jgi:chemotaxis methyl-accepting protein methylase
VTPVSTTGELTAADLAALSALLAARSGLAFGEDRWPFLRNRADEAMRRARFTVPRRWLDEVGASAQKRGAVYVGLEEALCVQSTGFFRYPDPHRVLRDRVVPAVVRMAEEAGGVFQWRPGRLADASVAVPGRTALDG